MVYISATSHGVAEIKAHIQESVSANMSWLTDDTVIVTVFLCFSRQYYDNTFKYAMNTVIRYQKFITSQFMITSLSHSNEGKPSS